MSLFFKKIQRKNPQDTNENAPKRWYISLKSVGMKREREIAILAADGTTLDPKEAELAFSRFGKVVVQLLLDGNTVEIANLGSFRLTASSDAADSKEELTANHVKNLNLRFIPYSSTKEALKKAKFIDLETM